ncbi:MAG: hypothetical protein JWM39_771 [Parcubacteria group bacterium]|jgi:hypothetical protein|nr:hypothetical protein [Parcubacteria group bacterium]
MLHGLKVLIASLALLILSLGYIICGAYGMLKWNEYLMGLSFIGFVAGGICFLVWFIRANWQYKLYQSKQSRPHS